MVLRLFNPTYSEINSNITFSSDIKEAWLTNMNEERREKISVEVKSLNIKFGHKKIVTVEVVI